MSTCLPINADITSFYYDHQPRGQPLLRLSAEPRSDNDDSDLHVLKVTPLINIKQRQGTFGRIYAVKYSETICAAKEFRTTGGALSRQTAVEQILRNCVKLRHPNVIQFLGVFYDENDQSSTRLPVMVMEMMADSLTSLVDKHQKIPPNIKFSIIHDVSLGLCYFHSHDPPIIHGELFPHKVLLTAQHVAKISFGVTGKFRDSQNRIAIVTPANLDFMPPEVTLANNLVYTPSTDIYSFAGIVLYTVNQQWPTPSAVKTRFDPSTNKTVFMSECEQRQEYLIKMGEEFKTLRVLVEKCLDNDPTVRPNIATICRRIADSKDDFMKESLFAADLCVQLEHMRITAKQLNNEQLQILMHSMKTKPMLPAVSELNKRWTRPPPIVHSMKTKPMQPAVSGLNKRWTRPPPIVEGPPLIPALLSGKYQLKWTQLADLPAPMFAAYVAVQDKKIYVCGGHSLIEEAEHHVYVYDMSTNQWEQLPPPGHYCGVPHIIGGKLVIIGGNLCVTREMTNKVSTLDGLTWTSHYPNLLSVRSRPGVVTHNEHVIVAGGQSSPAIPMAQDDIEILDWTENAHWRRVSITLPVPMWDFTPTICEDHLFIIGHSNSIGHRYNDVYKIPVKVIAELAKQQTQPTSTQTSSKYLRLASSTNFATAIVPSLSSPVVVGGNKHADKPVADIEMYNSSTDSWKNIGSLSSARSYPVVAPVNNSTIIVIGGCVICDTMVNGKCTSLTTMEMGQAELPKIKKCTIIDF